jgi:hypothetical protein
MCSSFRICFPLHCSCFPSNLVFATHQSGSYKCIVFLCRHRCWPSTWLSYSWAFCKLVHHKCPRWCVCVCARGFLWHTRAHDIFIEVLMLCPQLCLFPSRFDFCNPCYNLVFVQAQMLVPNNAFAWLNKRTVLSSSWLCSFPRFKIISSILSQNHARDILLSADVHHGLPWQLLECVYKLVPIHFYQRKKKLISQLIICTCVLVFI